MSKSLIASIKTNKIEKHFVMKQIEKIEISEIINAGIVTVPTIINNDFYYENKECIDFITSLVQYIKYSTNANMITTTKNTILDENEKCAICMGEFEIGESLHTFYCSHKFHKECSTMWRKTKNSCPICSKSLTVQMS